MPLEQAKSADSFVDSLGVNTHLAYTNTAYGNYADIIKPKLQELGVRHIRDGAYQTSAFQSKINDLGSIGIKSTLIFGGNPIREILSTIRNLKGSIEAAEGVNESDLANKFPYLNLLFPESTRAYQQQLWDTVKNTTDTNYLPVVLPSMGQGKNSAKVGLLASGDIGNMHSYPNLGNPPTDGLDWFFLPNAKLIAGTTKPLWSTETGYQTLVGSSLGISENVAGKYLPRIWLEQFNRGVKRVYLYELIDQKPDLEGTEPEMHFGLLRTDGTPKPSFFTLQNMIALLSEPNANFTPSKLDYTITGDTTDVHHTLLQKSTGEFYLILWQEVRSWDNTLKVDIDAPLRNITINLTKPVSRSSVFKPFYGIEEKWVKTNQAAINLDVRDHPLVLRLVP